MIKLFDGCFCSDLKVNPSDWNKPGASVKKDWFIFYRFYDPTIVDSKGKIKPKLCLVKGMNKYKTLPLRREATKEALSVELHLLTGVGLNPITKQRMDDKSQQDHCDINPSTPLIKALNLAKDRLDINHMTRKGIACILTGVEKAATELRFNALPVGEVSRKQIKRILERCGQNSKKWSATRFNLYRSYLLMLYKELVEQDAVTGNPIRDISKKTVTKKIRPVPTDDERKKIKDHLSEKHPAFYNFIQLFFHSGVRITELLSLKPGNVDLKNQRYRCIIKKGRSAREVDRTIKSIAVPLWEWFLDGCPNDHFIFGPYFKPALKPMYCEVPSRYWKKYVKKELGVTADFYSLKHAHTTEVVDLLSAKDAAFVNGHQSTDMVAKVYDIRHSQRQHERIKSLENKFA